MTEPLFKAAVEGGEDELTLHELYSSPGILRHFALPDLRKARMGYVAGYIVLELRLNWHALNELRFGLALQK